MGGNKQSQQQYTPIDTATSTVKEKAKRLLTISQGPVHGFPAGQDYRRNTYLNDVPVMNPDGSLNYQNFDLQYNLGNPADTPLATTYFDTEPVGANLLPSLPVTRVISDPTAISARVVIATQRFVELTDKNDALPTEVAHRLEVSSNGGPFVQTAVVYSGRLRTESYTWQYWVPLVGQAPWAIRVTRLTPASTSNLLSNETFWSRLETGRYAKQSTAGVASALVTVSAELYGGNIPDLSLDWEGMVLDVPHNWPSYSGTFNGTLVKAKTVCSNPAWVLRFILNQMGVASDVYSFYDFGRWCDTRVPDGYGGTRPRHTFNAYISKSGDLASILQSLLHSCRARLYDEGNSVVLVWDQPQPTVSFLFNQSNVIDGQFAYQTSPATTRYAQAYVQYQDPAQNYEVQTVSYPAGLTDGYSTSYALFGCTSRAEALAHAKWSVLTATQQTMMAQFKLGPEGWSVSPGKRIQIQDTLVFGGRTVSYSSGKAKLDKAITLQAGVSYTFAVQLDNSSVWQNTTTPTVTTTTDVIDFTGTAAVGAAWAISTAAQLTDWVVLESIGPDEDLCFSISAVQYSAAKWDTVEQISLRTGSISEQLPLLAPPANLTALEAYSLTAAGLPASKYTVMWGQPAGSINGLVGYELAYRYPELSVTWQTVTVTSNSYEISTDKPQLLQVRARSLSRQPARSSQWSAVQQYLPSVFNQPPPNVTGLSIKSSGQSKVTLSWDKVKDQQLLATGSVQVRHSPDYNAVTWSTATQLNVTVSATTNLVELPLLPGTYLVRTVNSQGKESTDVALVNTLGFLAIEVVDLAESRDWGSLAWPGVLDNCTRNANGTLTLVPATAFNNKGVINDSGTWNSPPARLIDRVTATYTATEIDFGGLSAVQSSTVLRQAASWINSSFNSRGVVQDMGVWNGAAAPASAAVEIRISTDGSTWLPWQPFLAGSITAWKVQTRLVLSRDLAGAGVTVQQWTVSFDLLDRQLSGTAVASVAGPVQVLYSAGFYKTPTLVLNVVGQSVGDTWSVDSSTKTGFSFSVRNSAGNRVSKPVTWLANGFGVQV